jgi:uncharacterized membrane protein YgcG
MSIENISVVDEQGIAHPFVVSSQGRYVRIKIGDANKTFRGDRTYVIQYHATAAVAQFPELDEIYWNMTGNEWNIPILQTVASVVLPDGTPIKQTACYMGVQGSKEKCNAGTFTGGIYTMRSSRALDASEGITVAVGFPKGVVAPYSTADGEKSVFAGYGPWIIGILLPVITFILSYIHWYRKGNDPKGRGVIIPQYDVPDQITPMEVAGIVRQKVQGRDIPAEIIYLATRGYLTIRQIKKTTLGFIQSKDYELTLLKPSTDLPNEFDRKLLLVLFPSNVQSIQLSALRKKFYAHVPAITSAVATGLKVKGYYSNLGYMKGSYNIASTILVGALWGIGIVVAVLNSVFSEGTIVPIIIGLVMSLAIYSIASRFFPAKTIRGVETKEYLWGLREYLQIAEKDRLEFHNAPEKNPELFQELLPYAMVLGVSKIWAKEFADITMEAPSWYVGAGTEPFNSIAFAKSMSSFATFASSSMGSTSGSSGGGFSGGGGGGGGGGGW